MTQFKRSVKPMPLQGVKAMGLGAVAVDLGAIYLFIAQIRSAGV